MCEERGSAAAQLECRVHTAVRWESHWGADELGREHYHLSNWSHYRVADAAVVVVVVDADAANVDDENGFVAVRSGYTVQVERQGLQTRSLERLDQ